MEDGEEGRQRTDLGDLGGMNFDGRLGEVEIPFQGTLEGAEEKVSVQRTTLEETKDVQVWAR